MTQPDHATFNLPDTDAAMPGQGPVRRADWFLPIWSDRRQHFSANAGLDRNAVVFLGDSITSGLGDDFKGFFPGAKLANRGIAGDTTRGMLYRLPGDVCALDPSGVVILAGTNDLEENAEPEVAAANLSLIVSALLLQNSWLPIVLCEVFPSHPKNNRPPATVRKLNELYAAIAERHPQISMVNTWDVFAGPDGNARVEEFPDQLHPNELGYSKWADSLRSALQKVGLIEG